eukprot:369300-Lingulodinium_polyedra.AAC.1
MAGSWTAPPHSPGPLRCTPPHGAPRPAGHLARVLTGRRGRRARKRCPRRGALRARAGIPA